MTPAGRVGRHGVDVREQAEHRAGLAPAQPCHEVRPLRVVSHQAHLEAGRAQRRGNQILGGALVSGRVDGVDAKQRLQQRDRLAGAGGGRHARKRPA